MYFYEWDDIHNNNITTKSNNMVHIKHVVTVNTLQTANLECRTINLLHIALIDVIHQMQLMPSVISCI